MNKKLKYSLDEFEAWLDKEDESASKFDVPRSREIEKVLRFIREFKGVKKAERKVKT